ncbi:aromatic ring-hydroxylating dioxygenase subunit alpha [Halobacteriovorax sp. HLS]|uniref:aromatic ring-hydroxylating oxygenase subunit alpha n=1 Tax=Halobacteriovorax sp. HLS TaxID=2234000 RepID=UPI000FDA1D8D|nr:aromatic ring-hydroxylating dioxygenase subunit alpha [Halobacteriovorax sp. HLS]
MSKLKHEDGQLKENWYIACLSKELKKKPFKVKIYDELIVLFRTDKGVSAQPDRCLHRYTNLSDGQIKDNCIRCPYHGWTYDKDGNVIDIPSEGPHRDNKVIHKNQTYSCIEQDGAIWIWMGKEAPTTSPPWRFPKTSENGWINYFMVTDFENNVTHLAENFMDVPHTVYVHKNWFRNKSFTKVPFTVDVKDARVLVTYEQEKDEIGVLTKMILNPYKKPMHHTDEFIYPNITRVDYMYGNDHGFIINSQITPVSDYQSRVYTYIAYKIVFGGHILKPFINFYTRKVIEQDVEIMANQGPNLKHFNDHTFRSTDADEVHIAIERLRKLGVNDQKKVFEQSYQKKKEFWI